MKAAEVLLEISPNARPEWANKLVKIYQLTYARKSKAGKKAFAAKLVAVLVRAGEVCLDAGAAVDAAKFYSRAAFLAKDMDPDVRKNINEKIQQVQAFSRTQAKIEALKKRLKDNPKDTPTRMALIRCHVVERDRPADAAAQLAPDVPAAWRTNVARAVKDPSTLDEATCVELGGWYVSLGKAATVPAARQRMFQRAGTYLVRFLGQHTADDAMSKTAEALLKSMGTGQYVWIDLLRLVPSSSSRYSITVPLLLEGSYALQLRFVRSTSSAYIYVYLPVGNGQARIRLRESYAYLYGLSLVDSSGKSTYDRTKWRPKLMTNVVQTLDVRVLMGPKVATISARVDGGAGRTWRGTVSSTSSSQPILHFYGSSSGVRFVAAQLRMLSGRARRLTPTGPTPKRGTPKPPTPKRRLPAKKGSSRP